MKYLGMDLGTKTLGLAVSDKLGIIASPFGLIKFNSYEEAAEKVMDIIEQEKIESLVLGLPKNMDNSLGFAAERSLKFKTLLETKCSLPIHLIDERLSTMEAERVLISEGISRKKRKNLIDGVSASIILDTHLRKVG